MHIIITNCTTKHSNNLFPCYIVRLGQSALISMTFGCPSLMDCTTNTLTFVPRFIDLSIGIVLMMFGVFSMSLSNPLPAIESILRRVIY